MIFGECPNCGTNTANHIADRTPCFKRIICDNCKQPYWLKHSRIDPEAYSESDFLKEFEVDEKTKAIKKIPNVSQTVKGE